jgi:hypothetical protein
MRCIILSRQWVEINISRFDQGHSAGLSSGAELGSNKQVSSTYSEFVRRQSKLRTNQLTPNDNKSFSVGTMLMVDDWYDRLNLQPSSAGTRTEHLARYLGPRDARIQAGR